MASAPPSNSAEQFMRSPLPSDPTQIEALYAFGYQLYQAGRYEDASKVFLVLTMLDGKQLRFLMAFGKSLHQQGHFTEAGMCYATAMLLAPDDPQPQLLSAQCLAATGAPESARGLLQEVYEVSCSAGNEAAAARAEELLARLPKARITPDRPAKTNSGEEAHERIN